MKKAVVVFCALCFGLFASELPNVIDIEDCSESDMRFFVQQGEDCGNVVEIPAGTILSLKGFLRGEVFSWMNSDIEPALVKIERTIYMHFQGDDEEAVLFSTDRQNPKPFEELFTGEVSIDFSVEGDNVAIVIGADVNVR